jgi:hypothetical protein
MGFIFRIWLGVRTSRSYKRRGVVCEGVPLVVAFLVFSLRIPGLQESGESLLRLLAVRVVTVVVGHVTEPVEAGKIRVELFEVLGNLLAG